jgi:hypothetical protein
VVRREQIARKLRKLFVGGWKQRFNLAAHFSLSQRVERATPFVAGPRHSGEKHMIRTSAVRCLAAIPLLLMLGCTNPESKFKGKWEATDRPFKMEFFGDGSGAFIMFGLPVPSTYKVEGKSFRMNAGNELLIMGEVDESGNHITVQILGATVLFQKTSQ